MRGITRAALAAAGIAIVTGSVIEAQNVLGQLGLTETAARNYVLGEITGPRAADRRSAIVIAGTRAFLKLPPAARGPAATALFAWAKAYVSSEAFKTTYARLRRARLPSVGQVAPPDVSVDQMVKQAMETQFAGLQQLRDAAAALPAAERAKQLEYVREQEAQLKTPEAEALTRALIEAQRAEESARSDESTKALEAALPADPETLLARRLREFLDATADANFSARTISLTGGPDGIEFVDAADRNKSWIWQSAVIAGREATMAARAAAVAWLLEIER